MRPVRVEFWLVVLVVLELEGCILLKLKLPSPKLLLFCCCRRLVTEVEARLLGVVLTTVGCWALVLLVVVAVVVVEVVVVGVVALLEGGELLVGFWLESWSRVARFCRF